MRIPHQKEIVFSLLGLIGILFLFEIYPQKFPAELIDQAISQDEMRNHAKETMEALTNKERGRNARNLFFPVEKHIKEFVGGTPRHDDMTMVICNVGEADERNQ